MLYNLQFTQALAALSTKLSSEERKAWVTSGALKKVKIKSPNIGLKMDIQICLCYYFYFIFWQDFTCLVAI